MRPAILLLLLCGTAAAERISFQTEVTESEIAGWIQYDPASGVLGPDAHISFHRHRSQRDGTVITGSGMFDGSTLIFDGLGCLNAYCGNVGPADFVHAFSLTVDVPANEASYTFTDERLPWADYDFAGLPLFSFVPEPSALVLMLLGLLWAGPDAALARRMRGNVWCLEKCAGEDKQICGTCSG